MIDDILEPPPPPPFKVIDTPFTVNASQLISLALKSCNTSLFGEIKLPRKSDKLFDTSFTRVIKLFTVSLLKELFAAILIIF